jgi:hypothetical protein
MKRTANNLSFAIFFVTVKKSFSDKARDEASRYQ